MKIDLESAFESVINFISFTLCNTGELIHNKIGTNGNAKIANERFNAVGLRCRQNLN